MFWGRAPTSFLFVHVLVPGRVISLNYRWPLIDKSASQKGVVQGGEESGPERRLGAHGTEGSLADTGLAPLAPPQSTGDDGCPQSFLTPTPPLPPS